MISIGATLDSSPEIPYNMGSRAHRASARRLSVSTPRVINTNTSRQPRRGTRRDIRSPQRNAASGTDLWQEVGGAERGARGVEPCSSVPAQTWSIKVMAQYRGQARGESRWWWVLLFTIVPAGLYGAVTWRTEIEARFRSVSNGTAVAESAVPMQSAPPGPSTAPSASSPARPPAPARLPPATPRASARRYPEQPPATKPSARCSDH